MTPPRERDHRHDVYTPNPETLALSALAEQRSAPDGVGAAVELMRRWTRLPAEQKPSALIHYRGIHHCSGVGFLAWLAAPLGACTYVCFKAMYPREAADFRAQVLRYCAERADHLSRMGGAAPGPQMGHALAAHARGVPRKILGTDAAEPAA